MQNEITAIVMSNFARHIGAMTPYQTRMHLCAGHASNTAEFYKP
jgi:hypothetical protein